MHWLTTEHLQVTSPGAEISDFGNPLSRLFSTQISLPTGISNPSHPHPPPPSAFFALTAAQQ